MQATWRALILAVTATLPTIVLAEDNPLLDEVIVTAPQVSDPLTIVTDPKSPRQPVPAHDGADYLRNIPGFSAVRKGGTDGDPVLRGLAGSRLNVLMDGQYILGGCGMRMDPPTAYVFPESYDRITVLKGPQTVLYGGGNLAGTALFERDARAFEESGMRGFGGVLVGSFDRHDEILDVTGGAPAGFARVIGTRTSANDYEDGAGNEVHSAYTRWSTSFIGGWTPDPDTRVELSVDRSDGEARYADRGMDGTLFDRTGYGMKLEKSNISPLLGKLEAQVYHNYVDHVMDNFSLRPKTAAMYMISNPDRTTQGARVAGELSLATHTSLTVGLDYQQNEHTLRTASSMMAAPDINTVARTPDMTFASTGIFAEAGYALDDRQRLVGGLRFDRLNVVDLSPPPAPAPVTQAAPSLPPPTAADFVLEPADTFNNQYGRGRFLDGGLEIRGAGENGVNKWPFSRYPVSPYRFFVSAVLRDGRLTRGHGIVIEADTARSNSAYFYVTGNGQYKLRFAGVDVIEWTRSPLIRQGMGERNELGVEISGNSVRLFINGQLVNQATLAQRLTGRIGFAVGTDQEVRFDRVRYEPIGAIGAPTPISPAAPPSRGFVLTADVAQSDSFGVERFANGALEIRALRSQVRWPFRDSVSAANRIEVGFGVISDPAITQGESTVRYGYGLAFAGPDSSRTISFLINGFGDYMLSGPNRADLIPWTRSQLIRTGPGAHNVLAVELRGPTATLFINGTRVNQWTGTNDLAGKFGFSLATVHHLRFDSVRVTPLR